MRPRDPLSKIPPALRAGAVAAALLLSLGARAAGTAMDAAPVELPSRCVAGPHSAT